MEMLLTKGVDEVLVDGDVDELDVLWVVDVNDNALF